MQNSPIFIDKDAHIESDLEQCVTDCPPKSFFLFAGAGSGKTASLVKLLQYICDRFGNGFVRERKKVAVITFTNAAADEIKKRINYNDIAAVSTIHSFVWTLIQPFQKEIKEQYLALLNERLAEKEAKLPKARNKEALSEEITKTRSRIEAVGQITKFIYNPNGDNVETNSLNHEDVIVISTRLLSQKKMLQTILISQYPILFIDESQDTRADLLRTFIAIQQSHKDKFLLGLFGDMKQRIYTAGEENIESLLDDEWAKPVKVMNWRSDKRIVKLINQIASTLDDKGDQEPRADASEGFVRLFVIDNTKEKSDVELEKAVRARMSSDSKDNLWEMSGEVKTLVLEHHIAASRLGFQSVYEQLYAVYKNSMGFMDGTLPELMFFSDRVLPLVEAVRCDNSSQAYRVLKDYSPWFKDPDSQTWNSVLRQLKNDLAMLKSLCLSKEPTIGEIVRFVNEKKLFDIPESIDSAIHIGTKTSDSRDTNSDTVSTWCSLFDINIGQMEAFLKYVRCESRYDTHQGVKGLQFPRVMVIIDDKASRGFLFKYEKLFGVQDLSKTDMAHIAAAEDNVISRTQRLFYVVCSRAIHSLAIMAYTENPSKLIETVTCRSWFEDKEIVQL